MRTPFGLGTLPATSWRPVRGRETGLLYQGLPRNIASLQSTIDANTRAAAAKFFSPAFRVEGMGGNNGSVVASVAHNGLAGLGAVESDVPGTRWTPAFCSGVKVQLAELEWLLNKAVQSSPVVQAAQVVYNELDDMKVYAGGFIGRSCSDDTALLSRTIADLRADLIRQGAPVTPGSPTTPLAQPSDMDPTVKFAIIGGIAVVGILGVAYITGQLAPLLRVVKR